MAEKPYLAAAFLCERVLQEKDEVLTAVRIVDTFFVGVPKNLPPDAKPAIQITALLSFKRPAGEPEGQTHQATLQIHSPDQTPYPAGTYSFFFKPGEEVAGANLIGNISLGVTAFGLFWLDVLVDGEWTTRIPFRLLEKAEEPPRMIH